VNQQRKNAVGLRKYKAKRDFSITREPAGRVIPSKGELQYVLHKHHASHLHYDLRLEADGVLKSWAVPKGLSNDPSVKRLAVEVEDHPLEYGKFEGEIPKGEYGAGNVIIWDNGTWTPPEHMHAAFKKGRIDFELHGKRFSGPWTLVRMKNSKDGKRNNWLLFKRKSSPKPRKVTLPVLRVTKGRKAAPPPKFVEPQLAQLVSTVPQGAEWIHEMKFDGYRTFCRIDGKDIRLITRSGKDWTEKYSPLLEGIKDLGLKNAFLDGEIVWIDDKGQTNFQGLQTALQENNFSRIVYYVFDILHYNGQDLRDLPLLERKAILAPLIKGSTVLYSEHFSNQGLNLYQQSCKVGLEGIVSKMSDAPYTSGRSPLWLKIKCSLRQEFVIGGYTHSASEGRSFRALLMGVYDRPGELRYVGRVGTGFNSKILNDLFAKMRKLSAKETPFTKNSPRGRDIHWLKPKLVAEVEFKTWTKEGIIRQASFKGLRADKPPQAIHVEKPVDASLKISHPDRILYPKKKINKLQVAEYYMTVAPLMMPFVEDRPLSILRCQETAQSQCFFQKNVEGRSLVGAKGRKVKYKDKTGHALIVENPEDIVQLIQGGVIEIHGWGARFSHIKNPDLIVFDLDPESEKLWPRVVETAHEVRDMLKKLKLESFVKVTGGKGVHVQLPIEPLYNWEQIKQFSKSLMDVLVERNPKEYTTNMSKAQRHGRIFLDYLRNGYGATSIVPYCLRARTMPSVAMPIGWKELKPSLSPDQFQLPEVLKQLRRRKNPWANYFDLSQRIAVLEN
jgi:bifunctional non-homologous end joining protein LigD